VIKYEIVHDDAVGHPSAKHAAKLSYRRALFHDLKFILHELLEPPAGRILHRLKTKIHASSIYRIETKKSRIVMNGVDLKFSYELLAKIEHQP
jgi:hypothetical protein